MSPAVLAHYRIVRVGAAIDAQKLRRDPRFLQYDGFQEPIKARVMVRFSFQSALSLADMYTGRGTWRAAPCVPHQSLPSPCS